jgi:biopolymer transport protein ExbB
VNLHPPTPHSISLLLAALLLLAGSSLLSAQTPPDTGPAAAPSADGTSNPPAPAATKSLWQLILEGGLVMIPIGLFSIATVYLIADGIVRTGNGKIAPAEHVARLKEFFQAGDYLSAHQFCKANPSPLNNVVRVGVSLLGEGKQVAEEGMIGELSKENSRLQTWISYLSVIGVCSPMIGLLGTVTGMIRAFATLGSAGIGDPSSLSSAIGEVLVATASGLFIAIPAFIGFYFLRNRATGALHHVQDVISSLFRKMPYEAMAGVHIGDEVIFAAMPNWLQSGESAPAPGLAAE